MSPGIEVKEKSEIENDETAQTSAEQKILREYFCGSWVPSSDKNEVRLYNVSSKRNKKKATEKKKRTNAKLFLRSVGCKAHPGKKKLPHTQNAYTYKMGPD